MRTFDVVRAGDAHFHFRDKQMIGRIIEHVTRQFGWAIAMGNITPLVTNARLVTDYRTEIKANLPSGVNFEPLMTVMLTSKSEPEGIEDAFIVGAVAAKLLPQGRTTNAHRGLQVKDIHGLWPVFERMQRIGMKLLWHAEHPGEHIYCMEREQAMLPIVEMVACSFPKLRIVVEHISSAAAVRTVKAYPNLWATITAHHMRATTNWILDGTIRPDHYCNPVIKDFSDRDAVVAAATGTDPKFMFGSDDAAHDPTAKYGPIGCAGVFNGPTILPLLIATFEEQDRLDRLNSFLLRSTNFYDQDQPTESITFAREPYLVPSKYNGLTPGFAGHTLDWWYV